MLTLSATSAAWETGTELATFSTLAKQWVSYHPDRDLVFAVFSCPPLDAPTGPDIEFAIAKHHHNLDDKTWDSRMRDK